MTLKRKTYNFFKRVFDAIYYYPYRKDNNYISGYVNGLRNVIFGGENQIITGCNFSGKVELGYRTTLGVSNWIHGNVKIGKYCQLGAYVAIHSNNHPVSNLSTYISSSLFNGELKQLKTIGKVEMGNDVWVGHNALIIGNVKIGNGAIIAAGAVVTRDVEPYSIVGGVPAKTLKKRFSENIIKEVEELKWWDKSDEEMESIKPLFLKDLSKVQSLY
jgi:acetyltransferase-like isoleucine patch superfamily enzyme